MIFESKNNETRSTPPHTKSTLFSPIDRYSA